MVGLAITGTGTAGGSLASRAEEWSEPMTDPETPINPAEDIEDEGCTDPLVDMG